MDYKMFYLDSDEREYITRFCKGRIPPFAPNELYKVENYYKAKEAGFTDWVLHHREAIGLDGVWKNTKTSLIRAGRYYCRPAIELIFLDSMEYGRLLRHADSARRRVKEHKGSTAKDESTRRHMSEAKHRSNGTDARFDALLATVEAGGVIGMTDYVFFRRHCRSRGIEPGRVAQVDKGVGIMPYDKPDRAAPKIPGRIRGLWRYRAVMDILERGQPVSDEDRRFMIRYCKRMRYRLPEGITE